MLTCILSLGTLRIVTPSVSSDLHFSRGDIRPLGHDLKGVAQWIKMLTAKPSDSSIPRTHMKQRTRSSALHMSIMTGARPLHTDKFKIESKIKINKAVLRQKWACGIGGTGVTGH